jgi:hypothetical protein
MAIKRVEYDLGRNRHGQPVRLVWEDGRGYTIHRDEANQRDDCQRVDGLEADQIRLMAECIKDIPGKR